MFREGDQGGESPPALRISHFLLASHSSFLCFTGNNCYSWVHFEHISTLAEKKSSRVFVSLRCPHVVHYGEMSHHVDVSTSTMLACFLDGLLILSSPIHDYIHSLRRQRRSYASSAWVHRERRMRKLSSVRAPRFALSDGSRAFEDNPGFVSNGCAEILHQICRYPCSYHANKRHLADI